MICIKKITDEDFGITSIKMVNPRQRFGARGIVFNDGKIAILNKQLKNEYKLVGGGIEKDEDPATAFQREVLEETGCQIEIVDFLGITEEYKSQDNFRQTSYVYVGNVINDTGNFNFTQKETEEGSKLLWLDISDALKLIKESENKLVSSKYESVYHTKFIVRRDYGILKYYIDNYLNK